MTMLKNGLGWQIGRPATSFYLQTIQHPKLFANYPGIFPVSPLVAYYRESWNVRTGRDLRFTTSQQMFLHCASHLRYKDGYDSPLRENIVY